jgi:hypothetical protein
VCWLQCFHLVFSKVSFVDSFGFASDWFSYVHLQCYSNFLSQIIGIIFFFLFFCPAKVTHCKMPVMLQYSVVVLNCSSSGSLHLKVILLYNTMSLCKFHGVKLHFVIKMSCILCVMGVILYFLCFLVKFLWYVLLHVLSVIFLVITPVFVPYHHMPVIKFIKYYVVFSSVVVNCCTEFCWFFFMFVLQLLVVVSLSTYIHLLWRCLLGSCCVLPKC